MNNLDPKSETDELKPDFEQAAESYFEGSKFPYRYEKSEAIDIYVSGADHGYSLLQSENQRLTEENNTMLESVGSLNGLIEKIEEAMEREKAISEEHHPTGFYLGLEHAIKIINSTEK